MMEKLKDWKKEQKQKELLLLKNFLKNGISIDLVSESTGLSVEELKELEKEV